MSLESEAVSLWQNSVSAPPGLLQTSGYAHEALAAGGATGEELSQQVVARLGRRELLNGNGPALVFGTGAWASFVGGVKAEGLTA